MSEYREIRYDYPVLATDCMDRAYNSSLEPAMTREALRSYLRNGRVLDEPA